MKLSSLSALSLVIRTQSIDCFSGWLAEPLARYWSAWTTASWAIWKAGCRTVATILPLLANAPDANTVLDAIAKDPESAGKQFGHRAGDGQPWTYLIQGSGKVLSVDTASRHGLMTVDIGPPASPRQLVLQIGPVVFGTALRDALPVISFGDFVNQIEYAEVSRALNDRAVAMARAGADPASLAGKMILFAGAATQPAGNSPVQVTPVSIAPAEGAHS